MIMGERLSGRSKQALRAFFLSFVFTLIFALTPVYRLAELRAYDVRVEAYQDLFNPAPVGSPLRVIGFQDSDRSGGITGPVFLEFLNLLRAAKPASIYITNADLLDTLHLSRSDLPPGVKVWSLDESTGDEVTRARAFLGSEGVRATSLYDADGDLRGVPWSHPAAQLALDIMEDTTGYRPKPRGRRLMLRPFRKAVVRGSVTEQDVAGSNSVKTVYGFLTLPRKEDAQNAALAYTDKVVFIELQTTDARGFGEISTPAGVLTLGQVYQTMVQSLAERWVSVEVPAWVYGPCYALFVLTLCFFLSGRRPNSITLYGLVSMSGAAILGVLILPLGYNLPIVLLLGWLLLAVAFLVLLELRRGRAVLTSFGGAEDAKFEGEESEASMVFTNIPPALMEMERKNSPDLLKYRRDYNTVLAHIAKRYHGKVLDYQGDAQMLGFGLRYDDDYEHAAEATAAALEIVTEVATLSRRWNVPPEAVKVHAGVCTGMIALGHLGAEQKQDIAAIGDTTNTAARLMGAAMKEKVPVLVAKTTYLRAEGLIQGESRPPVELKGKSQPVEVYTAEGVDEEWKKVNRAKDKSLDPTGGKLEFGGERATDLVPSLVMAGLGILLSGMIYIEGVLEEANVYVADHLHRAVAFTDADPRIVLIGLDEASISDPHLGRFPWSRGVYAQVIRNLKDTGYKGIFFDIFFKSTRADDPQGDEALAQALSDDPRAVVGGVLVKNERARFEDPQLFEAADFELLRLRNQIGLAHSALDSDGVCRAGYLALWETDSHDSAEYQKRRLYPSAATALLLDEDEKIEVKDSHVMLGSKAVRANVEPMVSASVFIRFGPSTTADGLPPQKGSYPIYSFSRLLDPKDPLFKELDGKYLLVGQTMTAGEANDVDRIHTVAGRIKGVEVHARLLDTLLNDNELSYPEVWQRLLMVIFSGLCTGFLLIRYREAKAYIFRLIALVALLGAFDVGLLYLFGIIGDVMVWWVTVVIVAGMVLQGRFFLTFKALTRVIPEEIAAELLFTHTLKDRRQIATILLTDIRGYTTLSEGRTAVAMLDVLNEYHKRTVACYDRYGGQALTYQGDAQIVVFGVFGNRPNPAADAVEAALGLQKICDDLREEWGIASREDFDVGAGLCTGEVEVGLLGGSTNLQYSVVGETVRKAHKVQSLSSDLDAPVILDEETYEAAGEVVVTDDLGMVLPKGLDHEIRLYRAKSVKPR